MLKSKVSVAVSTAALLFFLLAMAGCGGGGGAGGDPPACVPGGTKLSLSSWYTVVDNGVLMPDATLTFNSYNQPSVDNSGRVVFRARSKGPSPVHGIYMECGSTITRLADRNTQVPDPNNLGSDFTEFPSFPRIDAPSGLMAWRGNSQPVWEYTVDGTDTRVGTNGLFVGNARGQIATAVNLLGAVPGFEYFQVPGASTTGIRFDVFPGAPSPTQTKIVFKGNYTDNSVSETGVYYRDLRADKGKAPVELIANTHTRIPNQDPSGNVTFDSTAPPSAAGNSMVFVGLDNEASPTMGGIYLAPLSPNPTLTTLVGIGSPVPGVADETFNQFGEGLSFNGRYVAFWGAWGAQTMAKTLQCPTDGNANVIAYCNQQYPNGYTAQEPVNQGIFVYDVKKRTLTMVAETLQDNYEDFLYWNFSGKVPGSAGNEDGEPARWRSSPFVAASSGNGSFRVVFKATKQDGTQGIYLANGPNPPLDSHTTVLDTTMDANVLDPDAPAGLTITSLGIERDGFRGRWLTVTAGMANADSSVTWAGIYLTKP